MSADTDTYAPVWDHFAELRNAIIKCIIVIICGVFLSLCFYQEVIQLLTLPLQHSVKATTGIQQQELRRERISNPGTEESIYTLPANQVHYFAGSTRSLPRSILLPPGGYVDVDRVIPQSQLVLLSPLEGMLISFKVSLWVGLLGTSPFWIFALLKFISPGLRKRERDLLYPFLGLSALFIGSGLLLAYFVTIPLANQYLQAFNIEVGTNLWSLSSYINFSLFLLFANALALEMGLILFFLVHCGAFSADWMSRQRRYMIVLAFILGAILTPPDVLTQFLLAIPLIALYELAIVYARFREQLFASRQSAQNSCVVN